MAKSKNTNDVKDKTDPRIRFINYCKNFPIDQYNIPRPLKSYKQEIKDETCALMAFSFLSIPHEMSDNIEREPIGWLLGPHLLDLERYEDYSLGFCDEPLKSMLLENPWLLITESSVQLAVAILRTKCKWGNPRESKFAKFILKDIKLDKFIPKEVQVRRSRNIVLNYYKNYPDVLAAEVALYAHIIKKSYNPPYKSNERMKKKDDIEKAFNLIFQKDMPANLIFGERDNSPSNIALAFISFETTTQYNSVHKIYYDHANVVSKTDIHENLDFITDNKDDKIPFIKELKEELQSY